MKELKNGNLITEKEFIPLLEQRVIDFFDLSFLLEKKPLQEWVKRYYALLGEKAHDMESFLDDYNARNNQTFSYLTELFASLKWFGQSAFIQKHILIRFKHYPLDLSERVKEEFIQESHSMLVYLNQAITTLMDQVYEETLKIGIHLPQGKGESVQAQDSYEKRYLPHNMGDESISDPNRIIAELATLYKNICGALKKIHITKNMEIESIRNQTIYQFDETKSRHFETEIHNIQSRYDTYLKNTVIETHNNSLSYLRGFSSITFHLFEVATILVHFYERHMNDIRYEEGTHRVSSILSKDYLLGALNNYFRYYAIRFFLEGEKHADLIVDEFIKIKKTEITPPSNFSLHARPLSLVARIAMHYNTPLEIEVDGNSCNAGSIMQMILLAGNNPKPKTIIFRGEERALNDLKDLFKVGCLEDGNVEALPPHLNYLVADDPVKR